MKEPTEWDAWFAWLPRISPVSEQSKPMADHECRDCGKLDCGCKVKSCSN